MPWSTQTAIEQAGWHPAHGERECCLLAGYTIGNRRQERGGGALIVVCASLNQALTDVVNKPLHIAVGGQCGVTVQIGGAINDPGEGAAVADAVFIRPRSTGRGDRFSYLHGLSKLS
ncbi:hypothetical protein AB0I95_05965 [Micromonospora sp. NPDC049751]|uniref:hypothetical protein n=1 Tax=unclassified Micromonospora TaxID=2617518 RepID=UPI0033C6BC99